ncbi:MAG: hypothetical protein JXA10_13350 [Anaerolineae bacterium]|nr:hypothetical protein [Anaerolineae bacterium]
MLRSNPQRVAWMTVVGALAVFCVMCLGTYTLAHWVVYESPIQLNVVLHVGKGTVGLAEPGNDEKAERGTAPVARNDVLRTDSVSQGYLAFSDPYSGDVIATVMMHSDSQTKLRTASRPRFSWSDNPYVIRLADVTGPVEVWVASGVDREIRLEIISPLGTLHIEEAGNYLLDITPDSITVTPRVGSATLISATGQAQHLTEPSAGLIQQSEPDISMIDGPLELLSNWNFAKGDDWPVEWRCTDEYSADYQDVPPANLDFTTFDGRDVIHIERMQPNPGAHKTRCIQVLGGPDGLDVRDYDSVRLRVTMQVHHQSLSACGIAGTECPVMLQISYVSENGESRRWIHGFYANYEPSLGGEKNCAECWGDHEFINKDAWYTYESGNLFTILPEGWRPSAITEIHFFAGGHQYDVMLSEVALLAEHPTDTVTDEAASAGE